MATPLEMALMSANVYQARRHPTNLIELHPSSGWTRLNYIPDDPESSFSAGVFQRGSEIVIAYTGTNEIRDGLTNTRLGTGLQYDAQLEQAADLYLRTRRLHGENITLTGHSLGGGPGNDVYLFRPGSGNDTIGESGGIDMVFFGGGLRRADLIARHDGSSITIAATENLGCGERLRRKRRCPAVRFVSHLRKGCAAVGQVSTSAD